MSQSTESNTQDLLAGKQQDAVRRLFSCKPQNKSAKKEGPEQVRFLLATFQ